MALKRNEKTRIGYLRWPCGVSRQLFHILNQKLCSQITFDMMNIVFYV